MEHWKTPTGCPSPQGIAHGGISPYVTRAPELSSGSEPPAGGTATYHQPQHQGADALPDLRGDVVAKLLQGGQEALELAELAGAAGRGQLMVG